MTARPPVRDPRAFFAPDSVAVIGASARATSSGGAVLRNLIASGYPGRIVPVNPRGGDDKGEILGLKAATSLSALDEPVDLAVVVIRPDLILDVVDEAAATGHRNLMILPGGFAEAGADGAAREAALREKADAAGIAIFGPNCAGCVHLAGPVPFAASFLRDLPPGGGIALVSQSGAIAEEVIARANRERLPVGTVVSVGNGTHLGATEYLEYLGGQDSCTAVLLYIESIPDPERFRTVARAVAAKKPVVALVGGRTAEGGAAVRNHTGGTAMADADAARFMAECGVIRTTSLRRLLLAAKGFGFYPRGLAGKRVLLLSNSGGPGVIATDRLRAEGLALPPLPDAFAAALRAALPGEAAVANPVDLLADAREDRWEAAFKAAVAHALGGDGSAPAYDAVAMIHVVPFMVDAGPVIGTLARLAPTARVPVFHSMMGTLEDGAAWFRAMEAAGVPMFDDSEAMAEAVGVLGTNSEIINQRKN